MKLLIAALLVMLASPALAQQPSLLQQPNAELSTYRQLLDEANSRLANMAAQSQQQIQALQKQIADLKAAAKPVPATPVPATPVPATPVPATPVPATP